MSKPRDRQVLVVDDDTDYLSVLKLCMRTCGFSSTYAAGDGSEALDHLDYLEFDLIISDWNMAPIDGLGLLRSVRRNPLTAGVPFILMSAHLSEAAWREAINLGVTEFLVKPFSLSALRAACRVSRRDEIVDHPLGVRALSAAKLDLTDVDGRGSLRDVALHPAGPLPDSSDWPEDDGRWPWRNWYQQIRRLLNQTSV